MRKLTHQLKITIIATSTVISLIIPLFIQDRPYLLEVAIRILFYAFFAQTWNLTAGFTGLLMINHALYYAIGAYSQGIFQNLYGISPWLCFAIGAAISIMICIAFTYPSIRLKGLYLAMASLAFLVASKVLFMNWNIVGGAYGLSLVRKAESFFNLQFYSKVNYYYLILGFLIIGLLALYRIKNSRIGYNLISIREDEVVAASIGIDVNKYKLIASVISASLASVLGAFNMQYTLFTEPETALNIVFMFEAMIITLTGGIGTIAGPVIGSIIIIPARELTRFYFGGSPLLGLYLVIYGLIIMVTAYFFPEGVMGILNKIERKLEIKRL